MFSLENYRHTSTRRTKYIFFNFLLQDQFIVERKGDGNKNILKLCSFLSQKVCVPYKPTPPEIPVLKPQPQVISY